MASLGVNIDVAAIQAEIGKLTPEEIKDALLSITVRQKVQQKKHYDADRSKAYNAKRRERNKLLVAAAKELGLYEGIKAEANALADQKLAEDEADSETVE
jgi:hypothetical protein